MARRSGARLLVEGFVVGVTNPKSIAFFLAILPQFVDLHAGSVPMQLFVLGAIVVAIGVACDAIWVLLASGAREWFGRSPRRIEAMGATGGGLMSASARSCCCGARSPLTAEAQRHIRAKRARTIEKMP